jgi:hypothetical protein
VVAVNQQQALDLPLTEAGDYGGGVLISAALLNAI